MNVYLRNAAPWVALLACVLGVALLDRTFVHWRNDPRSFPFANGKYPTSADIDPALRSHFTNRALLKPEALVGAGLLGLSVVLFGLFPVREPSESTQLQPEEPVSKNGHGAASSPDQN